MQPENRILKGRGCLLGALLVFLLFILVFAYLPSLQPAEAAVYQDGTYAVNCSFTGGSGRGGVTAAEVTVSGGIITEVTLTMSSAHYDYAKVDGAEDKVVADTTSGKSRFTFPYPGKDTFTLLANTTAMSAPHEITYTVTLSGIPTVEGTQEQGSTTEASTSDQSETTAGSTPADTKTPTEQTGDASGETEASDQTSKPTSSSDPASSKSSDKNKTPIKGGVQQVKKSRVLSFASIAAGVLLAALVGYAAVRTMKNRKKSQR